MLAKITGTLIEKNPPQIVVDTQHGLAYEIDVPMSTYYNLPNTGEPVCLFLHLAIREDAQQLFGFASAAEYAVVPPVAYRPATVFATKLPRCRVGSTVAPRPCKVW